MSKLVIDLVDEIQTLENTEEVTASAFDVFLLNIEFDESGDYTSTESTEAVGRIEVNEENQECLFHLTSTEETLTVAEIKQQISELDSYYQLLLSVATDIDKPSTDKPIIGFGEDIERKRFFLVCES